MSHRTLQNISAALNSEALTRMSEALEEAITALEDELGPDEFNRILEGKPEGEKEQLYFDAIQELQEAKDGLQLGCHDAAHQILNDVLDRF